MSEQQDCWVIYKGYGMDLHVVGVVATEEDAKVLEAATAGAHCSDDLISYDGPFPFGAVVRGDFERVGSPDPVTGHYQTVPVQKITATVSDGVITMMPGERL